MNLTQSAPHRQERTTRDASETSAEETERAFCDERAGRKRRGSKLHKRPDFVKVPRSALKHKELDVRDALVYGLVLYRDRIGSRIGASEIGEVFGWERTTGWRALVRLKELGLIDEQDAPIAGALPDVGGFLKVRVEHVRELGGLEAAALVQLQTFSQLRMSKLVGRHAVVTARGLASLLGCCSDTALSVLKGLTNRVKRGLRQGQACVVKARVELVRALGRASRVRLLHERELSGQGRGKDESGGAGGAQSPVADPGAGSSTVPSREELLAMMRAARHGRSAVG